MKILVVHNRYVSAVPSGENVVVDDEIRALRDAGVEVVTYLRSSDEIGDMTTLQRAELAVGPLYSRQAARDIAVLIHGERPDVMHLHNPNPLISPAVVRVAKRRGVPVVQTVHNHRHVCIKGTYYRDGHVCRDCTGALGPLPGVRHSCYRDSRAQSAVMATALLAHRSTWQQVDRFLALSPSLADHLVGAGIPRERIRIRPNTVEDPGPPSSLGDGFVFVGRLREEKGIRVLLDAWNRIADGSLGPLQIVGDGPDRALVEALAARRTDVVAVGATDRAGVSAALDRAAVVVAPSVCPEVFPRAVVEAFAAGRPVVGSRIGGLSALVSPDAGWLVEPGNPDALAAVLPTALRSAPDRAVGARTRYEQQFSPDVALGLLLETYSELLPA